MFNRPSSPTKKDVQKEFKFEFYNEYPIPVFKFPILELELIFDSQPYKQANKQNPYLITESSKSRAAFPKSIISLKRS